MESIYGSIVPTASPYNLFGDMEQSRTVQEFRLVSNDLNAWSWIVGFFYDEFDIDQTQHLVATGAEVVLGPVLAPGDELFVFDGEVANEEQALYGELSYAFTDRVTGTVGTRFFRAESSFEFGYEGLLNGSVQTLDANSSSEEGNILKFHLSYDLNNMLLFAQAAQGYRPGGPNSFVPPSEGVTPTSYEHDSLWQYEFGIKSIWYQGALTANAALFFIDWSDVQTLVGTPNGFAYIDNLGDAHSLGFELDFALAPMEGLQLDAQITYTEAEFDEDVPLVAGQPELGLSVTEGQRLPNIPKWNYSLAAQYYIDLTSELDGFVRADWQYVGNREEDPEQQVELDAYGLLNLRLGIEADTWQLALFGKNVLDERVAIERTINLNEERTQYNQPRTIGLNVRKSF